MLAAISRNWRRYLSFGGVIVHACACVHTHMHAHTHKCQYSLPKASWRFLGTLVNCFLASKVGPIVHGGFKTLKTFPNRKRYFWLREPRTNSQGRWYYNCPLLVTMHSNHWGLTLGPDTKLGAFHELSCSLSKNLLTSLNVRMKREAGDTTAPSGGASVWAGSLALKLDRGFSGTQPPSGSLTLTGKDQISPF